MTGVTTRGVPPVPAGKVEHPAGLMIVARPGIVTAPAPLAWLAASKRPVTSVAVPLAGPFTVMLAEAKMVPTKVEFAPAPEMVAELPCRRPDQGRGTQLEGRAGFRCHALGEGAVKPERAHARGNTVAQANTPGHDRVGVAAGAD